MENQAIFLDRDGVINVDKGYTYKVEDIEIIPGVIEGLKEVREKGYKLIVVTNQSGIARGIYKEKDYREFRNALHNQLLAKGIYINAEYFCPHIEKDNCNCRKPKIGMLEQAAKDFHLNLEECWMIGDHIRDIIAGMNAGCKTIHVITGEEKKPILYADFVARDMIEAVNYILEHNKNK